LDADKGGGACVGAGVGGGAPQRGRETTKKQEIPEGYQGKRQTGETGGPRPLGGCSRWSGVEGGKFKANRNKPFEKSFHNDDEKGTIGKTIWGTKVRRDTFGDD